MKRTGLITTKIGNSSHYKDDGSTTHVTVLKVDECIVSNIKTKEKDGYNAVQLASIDTKRDISKIKKPQRKIYSSSKINPKKILKEFKVDSENILEVGTKLNADRSHGSTGQNQDPGRVFKGKKMAGRMGNKKVTKQNLKIIEIDLTNNLLIIKGSVPGKKNSVIFLKDSVKR